MLNILFVFAFDSESCDDLVKAAIFRLRQVDVDEQSCQDDEDDKNDESILVNRTLQTCNELILSSTWSVRWLSLDSLLIGLQ